MGKQQSSDQAWLAETAALFASAGDETLSNGSQVQDNMANEISFDDSMLFTPATTTIPSSSSQSPSNSTSPAERTTKATASQPEPKHRVEKRQRNTEAARRYRQRKDDKVTELEAALKVMTQERDELNLKLARAEAEVGVLRSMITKP